MSPGGPCIGGGLVGISCSWIVLISFVTFPLLSPFSFLISMRFVYGSFVPTTRASVLFNKPRNFFFFFIFYSNQKERSCGEVAGGDRPPGGSTFVSLVELWGCCGVGGLWGSVWISMVYGLLLV